MSEQHINPSVKHISNQTYHEPDKTRTPGSKDRTCAFNHGREDKKTENWISRLLNTLGISI